MRDITIEGCMNVYGAHIRLCIRDYVTLHKHIDEIKRFASVRYPVNTPQHAKKARYTQIINHYDTAKNYLFGGGLDSAIESFGLPINAPYVRRMTKDLLATGIQDDYDRVSNIIDREGEDEISKN